MPENFNSILPWEPTQNRKFAHPGRVKLYVHSKLQHKFSQNYVMQLRFHFYPATSPAVTAQSGWQQAASP